MHHYTDNPNDREHGVVWTVQHVVASCKQALLGCLGGALQYEAVTQGIALLYNACRPAVVAAVRRVVGFAVVLIGEGAFFVHRYISSLCSIAFVYIYIVRSSYS